MSPRSRPIDGRVARPASAVWMARINRAPAAIAIGAGICLIVLVVVVTLGVTMRYVIGRPILGVNEIIQLTAVALAMLALPYCTHSGGHVRVDIFDRLLGRWGRLFGDVLSRVLIVIALFHLCRQAWMKSGEAIGVGQVTNMLELPLWPFYGAVLVGMALCALIYTAEIVGLLLGWKADDV